MKRRSAHVKDDDTIAAISTPIGEGGIGIVRLSGPSSLKVADRIFASPDGLRPSGYRTHTVHYGHIVDGTIGRNRKSPKGSGVIDEVILTVMKAPKSYTKEDIVEINCHGGLNAVKEVLDVVIKNGARLAQPGEFTRRAFMNGRIDLSQAEAVLDLIRAKTDGALKMALSQLEGGLSRSVDRILETIVDIAAEVEASIDFPDEDIERSEVEELLQRTGQAISGIEELIGTYSAGSVLREGILAIICGKPNVGKSSLMNLLLNRDRVIVSPVPGTTRDAVEEFISIRDIPIRLVDTAGIAETKDALEREAHARSRRYLALADIAILVLDHSTALDRADSAIIELLSDKKKLVVINKCDLPGKIDLKRVKRLFKGDIVLQVSVENKKNMTGLEKAISDIVWSGGFVQAEGAVVSNARHKELLDKALCNMLSVSKALKDGISPDLISIDIKEAIFSLGMITGRSVSEDLLDRIFERFCIGK